ncbi:heavy metal-responsive transcriptional regulator [Hassallia byssoidea VB512170]|uniref:Heavy metal-responsive transcriptional regulator n=1 Tax=Hassallia byssoidea VB512170 TaxID=1304833 RepID=A0A846H5C9_9CYAN|nr:heavy metal-responsive transcriptional regulator [Hassalia byssoidea]NEU71800.1 heavy metal-responsive transcriptional regulator [Hassalia byssoidea VB512170]
MKGKQGLFIGELSRQVGISTQTIRYYERLGLLNQPKRTESQYRVYSDEDAERLQFIQKAKRFGLSLDEIKKLIDISAEGVPPCGSLKTMVKQHIDELERRIQELIAFQLELVKRYEQIEVWLPDSPAVPNDTTYNGKICKFIERG